VSQEGDNLPTDGEPARVVEGDCLEVLAALPDGIVDAVVSDPPYGLEFMGKEWDSFKTDRRGVSRTTGIPAVPGVRGQWSAGRPQAYDAGRPFQQWCQQWAAAALRVLKPGGYAAVFGGSRTYHRLACAVEDAGFEVRDCLMWVYGTGFPKGKGCLKPAYEPILLCRRPGPKVLPLGIDECRVPTSDDTGRTRTTALGRMNDDSWRPQPQEGESHPAGRWPANVVHDGSDEVMGAFAAFGDRPSGSRKAGEYQPLGLYANGIGERPDGMERMMPALHGSAGTAARFFYCAKASKSERGEGNTHPTVKPIALCEWLVRLVCPPGGLVLDPFAGSASVGIACLRSGRRYLGIEKQPEYVEIARRRLGSEGAKR